MNDLIEVMPFQYQVVESDNGGFRVEGVFQRSDVENANKRVYPRSIWEKQLQNPDIIESINSRSMYGELDHPADGKTKLQRVAHLITGLELNEDGTVTGSAEILPTPNGQILRALFESGAQVGISSRGSGSVQNGRVQEDFKLSTFDFVARPSTPGALPRPSGGFKGSRHEEVEDAHVSVIEDDDEMATPEVEAILAELNKLPLFEDASGRDFNEVARDVINLYNAVQDEDLLVDSEVIQAIAEDTLELDQELLRLAANNPKYQAVVSDLLDKVEGTRQTAIKRFSTNNTEEERSMNSRLEFIAQRLQEHDEAGMDEVETLRQQLDELSDDELIEVALEAGVIELDEDEGDAEEVTPEDLYDYIEGLEGELEEATELIQNLAARLEESEDVDDLSLKYETALNIIQDTVNRYQFLAEAVGGEDKAQSLMEAYLQRMEKSLEGSDVTEGNLNEDASEVADIERLLGSNGNDEGSVEDKKMARYQELSEAAIERLGLN
jgi:ribosomal protein L16 Arg81 hydroxylase